MEKHETSRFCESNDETVCANPEHPDEKGFRDAIGKAGIDGRLFSFAQMACQMRDREEAKRLYALIDELPEAKRPKNTIPRRVGCLPMAPTLRAYNPLPPTPKHASLAAKIEVPRRRNLNGCFTRFYDCFRDP